MSKINKKIVVIGAGVAGLSAGIYALKLGYRVELFEKNALPGGECTGWDRGGYHIDNCIHWLMGTTPGSDLYDLYRETRLIDDSTGVLRNDVMYTSWLNGQKLSLYSDIEKTRKEWIALSPEDEKEIEALFENVALGTSAVIPAGVPGEQLGAIAGTRLLLKSIKMFKLFATISSRKHAGSDEQIQAPAHPALPQRFLSQGIQGIFLSRRLRQFRERGRRRSLLGGSRAAALRMKARFEQLGGVYRGSAPVR